MIILDKCASIDELNSEVSHFMILNESGFYVKTQLNLTAFPFEDTGFFIEAEIKEILSLNEKFNNNILGGVFDGKIEFFERFSGTLTREALVFLRENYPSSKIYFYNSNLDYLLFLSGVEYGLLFTKIATGVKYFSKSYEEVIFSFFEFTLGWPLDWNMGFLNEIFEKTKKYNSGEIDEFINFLPVRYIKLT